MAFYPNKDRLLLPGDSPAKLPPVDSAFSVKGLAAVLGVQATVEAVLERVIELRKLDEKYKGESDVC